MKTKRHILVFLLILVFSFEYIQVLYGGGELIVLEQPTVEVFRGGKKYAFMFSWDDGGDDLRFSFLEDELGFKHTTFAVTSRIEKMKLWGLDMLFRGHDIQSHSREHVHHASINMSYCEYLLQQSITDIERVYGYTPIMFAYPYGSQTLEVQSLVLQYFTVGRGISYESGDAVGTWPIEKRGNCLHSFPGIDGVKGTMISQLISSFNQMISHDDGVHRAYKCYGHSRYFTDTERVAFFELLKEIAFRNDTWYTSWGEAVAYEIQSTHVKVENHLCTSTSVSFRTSIDSEFAFGIPLTYRVEIPECWTDVSVSDGGKISHSFEVVEDDERKYILIDTAPHGQRIEVVPTQAEDSSKPVIENLRAMVTEEGVAFLADVYDDDGLIRDVNITVVGQSEVYDFIRVQNPVFWANSTYGCVAFDLPVGCYVYRVAALDSSGNRAQTSRCFEVV